jgi:hypothetical protein
MSEAQNHLAIWNQVEATNPEFTKGFNRGGGFKGTATNVTYLVKKATHMFGPVGIGWGWKVLDETIMEGAGTDRIHRVKLQFWYMWNGQRGEIEHFGQTTFVGKNKNGAFTDEEAPKKSLTDALSKCLSMLGFAADVHMGLYDDNKYVRDLRNDFEDRPEFSNDNHSSGKSTSKPDSDNVVAIEKARSNNSNVNVDALFEDLKSDIDKCMGVQDVVDMMNHKDTKDDLLKLSKEDEKLIREHATAKLKELGWCAPKKEATNDV